jgi:magnesium transporter
MNASSPNETPQASYGTVGDIMTDAVPTALDTATIGDIERHLFQKIDAFRSINYTYILDAKGLLRGIISIKELFRQPKDMKAVDAMRAHAVAIHPHARRDKAAQLALQHSIKAVPVTDQAGKFLGVVLSDAILKTLYEKTTRDMLTLAGVRHTRSISDAASASLFQLFKHRLPWLLVGIVGSLFAAGFIHNFETTLQQNLLLAAFIPLVVYVSSAVAEQTQAFVIRDMAVNPSLRFSPYFLRQTAVTFLIGLAVSPILLGIGFFLHDSLLLGVVLALSNFFAILASVLTGLILPYFGEKLFSIDPADDGGPIATIVQDVLSVFIYFATAMWLL